MKLTLVALALLAVATACVSPAAKLPPPPPEAFRIAEDAVARHDWPIAITAYRQFLAQSPTSSYLPRAYYQLAFAEHQAHDDADALDTLNEMKRTFPGPGWVQADTLRGDIERSLGKPVTALMVWEQAWLIATPVDQGYLNRRIATTSSGLDDEQRAELNEVLTIRAVREIAGLGPTATQVAIASSDRTEVTAAPSVDEPEVATSDTDGLAIIEPSELVRDDTGGIATAEVAEGGDTLEPPPIDEVVGAAAIESPPGDGETAPSPVVEPTTKVGCLMALTGPDHVYGQRSYAGLRLAFTDVPEQLVVRDTGGDPALTAAMMTAFDRDPAIVAVIGPVRSADAAIAAPLAERAHLPLLLLAQTAGLTGEYVLQASMTRTQQMELLVSYASDTLGIHRFGVAHPDDGYGRTFAKIFSEVVTGHGGSIVGTLGYRSGNPDLDRIGPTVVHWQSAGVEAVFVPDGAVIAGRVAAEVRRVAPEIMLLGTEGWNDPAALAENGSTINGAIFADAFFVASSQPSTQRFVERFERGTGRAPSVFEAQAFDAGMAMRRVLADGVTARAQVIDRLKQLGTVEESGELRASPAGLQRVGRVLRYNDGKVEEITPSTP